jgi:hypothetical protein
MKRIIVTFAIVLAITLMTLSLQSCFVPYHDRGDDRGDRRDGPPPHPSGPPGPPHPSGPPMPPHPPGMPHP